MCRKLPRIQYTMDLTAIDSSAKVGGNDPSGFIKKNGMVVVLVLCVLILACLIYPIGGDYSNVVIGGLAAVAIAIVGWLFFKL